MRLSPLTVAALVALAPAAGRGEEALALPAPDVAPSPDLTPERAAAVAAAAEADARSAAAASLPLPEATRREAAEAKAVLSPRRSTLPRLGVAVGGGFPDLATASILFRPVDSVRVFGGPSWGYVGWGLQGGVVLVPWNTWISPTLSLEGGRLFRSDLAFLAKDEGGVPAGIKPILRRVDYQYAALDLGLELGGPSSFAFSVRVGLAYVAVKANGTATYTNDDGTTVSFTDPAFHGTLPSLKLGLQYWF